MVVAVAELWLCRRLFIFVGTPAGLCLVGGFSMPFSGAVGGVESYEP